MRLSDYSRKAIHFYDARVPRLLARALRRQRGRISMLDIGCGDGALVLGLQTAGLVKNSDRVLGTDLSPLRIERFRKNTGFDGVVCDAADLKCFDDASFDFVACTKVIEHVPDPRGVLREIRRLLKAGGRLYLSTAFKKWYGWYFYRSKGRWVLDPTHVREYRSEEEVLALLRESGLVSEEVRTTQLTYSVLELLLRLMHWVLDIEEVGLLFRRSKTLSSLRRISIPIIGYRYIEVLCRKGPRCLEVSGAQRR